jgi:CheY-like chemotaxis protein
MAKIVLIEDDPALLRVTRRGLTARGHAVVTFENGRGAIDHLQHEDPDLLITDIFMPEMEGIETIQRVRALKPDLPIIAISGFMFGSEDYLEIAEKFGAIATLKKPFRPAELLELVSRLLSELRC